MAFFLAPRFAPAYAPQCNPWSCAPARPSYRRVSRPSLPSLVPFLSQVDELLSELNHEARREAHRQRQQRKRIVRAHFNLHEQNDSYQVDGEIPGFEHENIEIEVTDENTLRVTGNTERKAEQQPQPQAASESESKTIEAHSQDDTMEGATLAEPQQTASVIATPAHSDTESHRSHQATVEDDFEDLGAEIASTLSAGSDIAVESKESKGKEKVVNESTTVETAVQQQLQSEVPTQQHAQSNDEDERFHGWFERTFRFPERIDAANVRASLRNGLLSITVPKAKAPEVRRVSIQ